MIATLFYHPMVLPTWSLLIMLLPLCLVVSIIYKTVRLRDISRLLKSAIWLFLYIIGGLVLLCTALVLILKYWP